MPSGSRRAGSFDRQPRRERCRCSHHSWCACWWGPTSATRSINSGRRAPDNRRKAGILPLQQEVEHDSIPVVEAAISPLTNHIEAFKALVATMARKSDEAEA